MEEEKLNPQPRHRPLRPPLPAWSGPAAGSRGGRRLGGGGGVGGGRSFEPDVEGGCMWAGLDFFNIRVNFSLCLKMIGKL